jgi:hypothetical protein
MLHRSMRVSEVARRCYEGLVALRRSLGAQGDGLASLIDPQADRLEVLHSGAIRRVINDAQRVVDKGSSRAGRVVEGHQATAEAAAAAEERTLAAEAAGVDIRFPPADAV